MALFGRDREHQPRGQRPEAGPPPDPAPREVKMFEREKAQAQAQEPAGTSAFLGKGCRVNGKLSFEGAVRIEAQIEGEIASEDTLTVGESAVLKAKINGTSVVVHGQVTGDIVARSLIELHATAKVLGNISSPRLVVHEGAIFEGQCTMGGAQVAAGKKKKPDFSALLGGQAAEDAPPPLQPEAR
ncbi:MAG TPA: polymer-forming cytoskeletal protein [Candidatus Limnocylindria bacterium]|nr:polymer-forming cytoskeletal protein [Candidatus Limnocylindria bacterium]